MVVKMAAFDPIGEKKSRAMFDSAPQGYRDVSLVGPESRQAIKKGLASGTWFVPKIDRKTLRVLMKRDNWHAVRDTVLLFAIIGGFGYLSYVAWQAQNYFAFALTFWVYCTFYTSSGDSRWHECGHGTAFRTRWMNDVLYNIASFMVLREPTVWRFSHARHHTDTDVVGRDPEIDGRPLSMCNLFLAFFNYQGIKAEFKKLFTHAAGSLSDAEQTFVPPSEKARVYREARIWLTIFASAIAMSFLLHSPLPAMYVFLPYSLGAWHFVLVGVFQHAGLEHDVLDHRLNTRTCYVNPISAFIYWNMHYHIEHHSFPMVPYYNLPKLHEILKPQLPKPYNSMWEVYREMIPALRKQMRPHKEDADGNVIEGPLYFIDRRKELPLMESSTEPEEQKKTSLTPDAAGWVAAVGVEEVPKGEVERFDVGPRTYCVYHAEDDDQFYATAGLCTHGAASLGDGMVTGNLIECPKHNGCFDFKTGLPKRPPVKTKLATYPVKVEDGIVYVNIDDGKNLQVRYDEDALQEKFKPDETPGGKKADMTW